MSALFLPAVQQDHAPCKPADVLLMAAVTANGAWLRRAALAWETAALKVLVGAGELSSAHVAGLYAAASQSALGTGIEVCGSMLASSKVSLTMLLEMPWTLQ